MGDPDMVIPELEGEGNLLAAVKRTMMALRSRKNLTDDEMEILGDLHTQLTTTITIGERKADENNKIEKRLNVIQEKIMSWDRHWPMIWDSHLDQATAYLNAAGEVRELNERLETLLCRNDDSKKKMLQRAQKVLQLAMKRLEEVFKHTLVENRQPFEPNHASVFLSAANRVSKISPGDYLVENSDDRCIFNRNSEEFIIDLVQYDVISELRRIANLMFISGYGDECSLAYINLRRDAWNECLFNLEKEKPRIEDVLCSKRDNFESELDSIKSKNKRWIQNMKIFVRVYLASEKWLSGQIFGELSTVNLVSLSGDLILLLLKYFGKDISIYPLNPEKLFHNLDIYEVLAGLHPNVDSLYSDKDFSRVRVYSDEVLRGLADSVRRTLHEFPNYIVTYITRDSFANIPSEGIHPLTKYVMKYISTLADYSETLNFLLRDYDGEDPMLASPCKSSDVEEENISGGTCDFSPIAHSFRSNASILKWLYSGSPMSSAMQEERISRDTSNFSPISLQLGLDASLLKWPSNCFLLSTATEEESINGGTCDISPVALYFRLVASILEYELFNRAKSFKDASLQHVFLMNNMHYMAQEVVNSNLQSVLGDGWIRRDALDEFLLILEMEKLSIEDVQRLGWDRINSKIRRWVRTMKIFVRIYLASEKCLSEQIFGDLGTVDLVSFAEAPKASVLRLLNFGEAVSNGPHKPEKLFPILDMYEVLADLLPDIDSLFADEAGGRVRIYCREVLRRLGDSVRAAFLEFENAISTSTSTDPIAGGGVHPLTKYVMSYLNALTGYRETLNFLLKDQDGEDTMSLSPDINPSTEEENAREGACDGSPLALHFRSVASILECNLDDKAKLYRDASLQHIFLMNNIHYMAQKVMNSNLQSILGDGWIRKHNWKFQQHEINYERNTWSSILATLEEEGNSNSSRTLLKERFRNFYTAFEEVYRTQTAWSIPNAHLREDLRISTSLKVIPAYRTFVGRHTNQISDKHIKYSADDLQNYLLDLFEGSQRSLHNPHRRS
ncbi:exocyst complex component EXO70E2-like [Populus nigra]|uniref:exocyst complex component EXO70E2-like n=1 Tax=Populus nigra TaxID=3691 RepID=UPI002B26DFD1|nr:exocyst complex component EXO70E2-like [Populus nigra]XP_061947603.1 exocyst complex component EXO70E2-like [Populus nigra]